VKIKQAKLAQALHGESSNVLNDKQFNMVFANNYLTVTHKNPDKANTHGPFIVFPANIAYLVELIEKEAPKPETKAKK
jgi:hypothetical protein